MPDSLPALIFDLDGTLTDSKPGIVGCLQKTVDAWKIPDAGTLDRFVGPPADLWPVELLPDGSAEEHAALVRDYRACYDREGWKNNSVYAGVRELLVELRGQGFPLYVCTSKPEHAAVRILDLFELTGLFEAVYGDKAEYANHSKALLLGTLLREHSLDRDSTWMIGDRIYDFEAARANEIRSLGAGWGYGGPEELALAEVVAATPAELPALISR
jgi:phosphoglycolate phosphatase